MERKTLCERARLKFDPAHVEIPEKTNGDYMADELESTLSEEERKAVWESLKKLGYEIDMLKGIVQNPMAITHQNVVEWSKLVEGLRKKLLELQQDVVMTVSPRIK